MKHRTKSLSLSSNTCFLLNQANKITREIIEKFDDNNLNEMESIVTGDIITIQDLKATLKTLNLLTHPLRG